MARRLIEYNAYEADTVSYSGYNSSKTVVGPMIYKFSGVSNSDYYVGPPSTVYRNFTQDTGLNAWGNHSVVRYNDTEDLIFSVNTPYSSVGLRVSAHRFNKITGDYTYLGQIFTNTSRTPGNVSGWGVQPIFDYYTAGTVSVSGKPLRVLVLIGVIIKLIPVQELGSVQTTQIK